MKDSGTTSPNETEHSAGFDWFITSAQIEQLRLFFAATSTQLALLALLTLAAYLHTLDVPFYLDDYSSIYENESIYDIGNFQAIYSFAPMRWVGYYSFALNFYLHNFSVTGYHIFNIGIHILTGLVIWTFTQGLLRTPALRNRLVGDHWHWLPFVVAALFLLHPLHTQSITYIVQRLASLVALFYFAALSFYVHARLNSDTKWAALFWVGCLCSIALALFTKQNAVTVPAALFLIEVIFFAPKLNRVLLTIGVALGSGILLWILIAYASGLNPFALDALETITKENQSISRLAYFNTQIVLLWHYMGLFFWPMDLRLEYAFPLASEVIDSAKIGWMASHLAMIGLALGLTRRLPLVAFAILFYYLAHSIESGIIPIADNFFEHRAYLPDLALCLLSGQLLVTLFPILGSVWSHNTMVLLLAALLVLTWQRNELWRNPVLFYKDNLRLTPNQPRVLAGLSRILMEQAQYQESLDIMNKVIAISKPDQPGKVRVSGDVVVNLIWALTELNQDNEALALSIQALGPAHSLRPADESKIYVNQGNIYYKRHELDLAGEAYRKALKSFPYNISALANMAMLDLEQGRFTDAQERLRTLVAVQPKYANAAELLQQLQTLTPVGAATPAS